MANHKSAIKQWRQNLKKHAINQSNKSILRTQIKALRNAIQNKNTEEARALLPETFSTIDKSIKKGTIHENQGNRQKSRLSRQVELLNASPSK
ncbi:MAG: 30S ribosomal protein S20 [Candidatus Aminicenantes bacterium]|nr:30S ribosomal protein S20 [Candidatus Aminicenantes bacterium]